MIQSERVSANEGVVWDYRAIRPSLTLALTRGRGKWRPISRIRFTGNRSSIQSNRAWLYKFK